MLQAYFEILFQKRTFFGFLFLIAQCLKWILLLCIVSVLPIRIKQVCKYVLMIHDRTSIEFTDFYHVCTRLKLGLASSSLFLFNLGQLHNGRWREE